MEEFAFLGGCSSSSPAPFYTNRNANTNNVSPAEIMRIDGESEEIIRAKIVSHPHYSNLITAFLDCQKIGAPPDVAASFTAAAREVAERQRTSVSRRSFPIDPELDQFMEAYCNMLVKYKEELSRPIQEAAEFFKRVESQLSSITNGVYSQILSNEDKKYCGVCSSEEEEEGADGGGAGEPNQEAAVVAAAEIDPQAEEKMLKNHLLKKYSGYLKSLRQELSKKRKKGKLPKEARQKLLHWWELHYKWPYPSETEKVALATATGLDPKQINNWFINQRKRHWKPSEDMQLFYHPHNTTTPFYIEGPFMAADPTATFHHLGP